MELVRIEMDGKDAVDFALAYYLGRKATTDPAAFFHIVSKDNGFDPLIEHLKSRRLKIRRHHTVDLCPPRIISLQIYPAFQWLPS